MTISLKTRVSLWGRAAARCSIEECRRELIMDASLTDDVSSLGESCHIVAESLDGPRGDSPLPLEKRNLYDNLVLLCPTHHKLVDDQPNTFTIDMLHQIKRKHEQWVRESLENFDPQLQRDNEVYASYIQEWTERAELSHWLAFSSWILSPNPEMNKDDFDRLDNLQSWIFARIWPHRYDSLETSFQNFRYVLSDFLNVFQEHAEQLSDGRLWTRKFYKIDEWNEEKYFALGRQYHYHVALVHDLMLELTRATNYVCDKVRENIDPTFRISEGVILAEGGDLLFATRYRPEYLPEERVPHPYPGLDEFKKIRPTRSIYFSAGTSADDPEFLKAESKRAQAHIDRWRNIDRWLNDEGD